MRLAKKEFAAWLAKHKKQTFVTNDPDMCALSCYLSEKVGEHVTVTSPDAYSADWEMTLPRWATDFVDAFDASGKVVRGSRALALL